VRQLIEVARRAGTVVCDLARWPSTGRTAALDACQFVVLVARADVPGLLAARTVAGELSGTPTGVVLRARSLPAAESSPAPVVGRLPGEVLSLARDVAVPTRSAVKVARGVLDAFVPAGAS